MGPQRLDRCELRDRLAAEHPGWITDELADLFEGPFLNFQPQVSEAARKRKKKPADGPRARLGREAEEDGDA